MRQANAIAVYLLFIVSSAFPQQSSSTTLTVDGAVKTPLHFTVVEFANLPHHSLTAFNEHEKRNQQFSGVFLTDLLKQAGVPGGEELRGKAMALYVVLSASDGYRVVYSLAELDDGIGDAGVLIADELDGRPLDEKHGPFQAVAPRDKRPARWIRMLTSISVRQGQ